MIYFKIINRISFSSAAMKRLAGALGLAAAAGALMSGCSSHSATDGAIDFPKGTVPAIYMSIRPGMTEAQVRSICGKPAAARLNPRFEVKTDDQWRQIQARYDELRQAQQNPSSLPDPNYIKLGDQIEHRVKDQWVYYPEGRGKFWVSFDFDGHDKLLSAASGPEGTPPPHGGPAHH